MKKFLITVICLLLFSVAYANSYDEFMKEAEKYEKEKEWFYALGAYYNAMKFSDNSDIAQQKYIKLSDCIKSGKPGFGEFDVFSMHDEWVNLIKNAEKYFTETFPYTITYNTNTLKMDSANYETKTANYKLGLTVNQSDFYKNAKEILKTGYNNTNHSDWKDLESDYKSLWFISNGFTMLRHSSNDYSLKPSLDFYRKSVYSTKQKKINHASELPVLQKEANDVYQKDKIAISYLSSPIIPTSEILLNIAGISICEVPAFSACFSETIIAEHRNYEVQLGYPYFAVGNQTCYDLKLGVYDENENLIAEGTRQTICTGDFSYIFSNIPQEKLSVLDSKKYVIKIIGIWLNYGVYDISLLSVDDMKNYTIRGIVKPLPDIKIELEGVEVLDEAIIEEKKRLEEEAEKIKLEAELAFKQKEWDDFLLKMNNQYNNYENYYNQTLRQAIDYSRNFHEKSGTGIALYLTAGSSRDYKDLGRKYERFTVAEVIKKSIGSKNKIKRYDQLIKINGTYLSELIEQSELIRYEYHRLGNLIYNANESDLNKLSKLKQEYETLKLKKIEDILFFRYEHDNVWYLAPLKSGTVLTFQDSKNSLKTIEIVVP